jgi:hypothetical protein
VVDLIGHGNGGIREIENLMSNLSGLLPGVDRLPRDAPKAEADQK